MRRKKFFNKLVLFFNAIFALALLLGYILPFIPPKHFPILSVLSLGIGPLLIINLLFFLYWLFKVRKEMLLSLISILIGFVYLSYFYKFSESRNTKTNDSFTVMSYNVKSFNRYEWIPEKGLADSISNFIKVENPQILAVQEYFKETSTLHDSFKYSYIQTRTNNNRFGQAIFSNFPIVNSGSVDFDSKGNNAIFSDLVIQDDTIRIYNVHFESLRIKPQVKDIQEEGDERLLDRMGKTFTIQQEQMEKLKTHIKQSEHSVIICSDFNNSAFSYVYRTLKDDRFKDAFRVAGNGFGRTFDTNLFPLRIDFILADEPIKVKGFKTFTVKYSDHFPIKATLQL